MSPITDNLALYSLITIYVYYAQTILKLPSLSPNFWHNICRDVDVLIIPK